MTNNQLCNFIGALGCVIAFFGMGLIFFGVSTAVWVVIFGVILGWISIYNYD